MQCLNLGMSFALLASLLALSAPTYQPRVQWLNVTNSKDGMALTMTTRIASNQLIGIETSTRTTKVLISGSSSGNLACCQKTTSINATNGGSNDSSNRSSSDDSEHDTEGFTRANKIAIGVGLGIVLPSCLASVINLLIRIRELRQELRDDRKRASGTEDIELKPGLERALNESMIYRSGSSNWRFMFKFVFLKWFWRRGRKVDVSGSA
jgi:hypothetical protein